MPPILFQDVGTFDRLGSVRSALKPSGEVEKVSLQGLAVGVPPYSIHPRCGFALEAVRSGKWKLHLPHGYRTLAGRKGGTGGQPVKYEQGKIGLALFDLEKDIGERHDVSAKHPKVVERLLALADQVRQDLGDSAKNMTGRNRRPPGRL